MVDLSICSVSFHNAPHLVLNWELATHLNPDFNRCRWLIAENTPADAKDRLAATDSRFELVPGASPQLVPNYQHTEALHACLKRADSRFVLVLDPDFYIVRPGWIATVLSHMQERNLSFFGVPWHPRNTDKYRYFPCVHCLFVDQQRVPVAQLDFRPDREDQPVMKYRSEFRPVAAASAGLTPLGQRISEAVWQISGLHSRRKDYCDTGTRFYQRFHRDRSRPYELALPVLRLPAEAPVRLSWRGRLLDALLPDSLCYLPKRRNSYTGSGLRERGYLRDAPAEWEEFMWNGAPFGFHMRRNRDKGVRDENAELAVLIRTVEDFAPGAGKEAGLIATSCGGATL